MRCFNRNFIFFAFLCVASCSLVHSKLISFDVDPTTLPSTILSFVLEKTYDAIIPPTISYAEKTIPEIQNNLTVVANRIRDFEAELLETLREVNQNLDIIGPFCNYLKAQVNLAAKNQMMFEWRAIVDSLPEAAVQQLSNKALHLRRLIDEYHNAIYVEDGKLIKFMIQQIVKYDATHGSTHKRSPQAKVFDLFIGLIAFELEIFYVWNFELDVKEKFDKQTNFTSQRNRAVTHRNAKINLLKQIFVEEFKKVGRHIWIGDPSHHKWGKTHLGLTGYYQGILVNEHNINANGKCDWDCKDYGVGGGASYNREGSRKGQGSHLQRACPGSVTQCSEAAGKYGTYYSACLSDNHRRYKYTKSGKLNDENCEKPFELYVSRYVFWDCEVCRCRCDDTNGDRHFSTFNAVANVNNGYVVSGMRFESKNGIFYLNVQQSKLLSNGRINVTTSEWLQLPNESKTDPTVKIVGDKNAIKIFDLVATRESTDTLDILRVLTGVQIDMRPYTYDCGSRLNTGNFYIKAKFSKANYTTGEIIEQATDWVSPPAETGCAFNDMSGKDIPTRIHHNKLADAGNYRFGPSSFDKDAEQTALPLIDLRAVESEAALTGVGFSIRRTDDNGGIVAPKLITYSFADLIQS